MALVIKKAVDLSSLGSDYEGIELVFRSIPAKDLPELDKRQSELKRDEQDNPVLSESIPLFTNILQSYFISGVQGDEKVTKEDIAELDSIALIYCFQVLSGQTADPKVLSESTNTSTTPTEPAEK